MSGAKYGLYCPRLIEVTEALGQKNSAIGVAYRHFAIALAALAQIPRDNPIADAMTEMVLLAIIGMGEVLGITDDEQDAMKTAFANDANELAKGILK